MEADNWKQQLSEDQLQAAVHVGGHARLLAGPGTGKTRTLTRRILNLAIQEHIDPASILSITFTRMAAAQLREEIGNTLRPLGIEQPRVSTLHSFALRQLMKNAPMLVGLPVPLSIADDWEERFVIEEDLKDMLKLQDIREVRDLLNQLSAGFETLTHEEIENGKRKFPDPRFLGAWGTHRKIYGYTLRAELVYQLKQALEKQPEFKLEEDFKHLLVDEYQDLNACDLAIVKTLAERGIELFVAGDDDQSIYGFRFADPSGIRNFSQHYPDSADLSLEICYRCDRSILEIADFVANQDLERLQKPTRSRDDAGDGIVEIHNFRDQHQEAAEIAEMCDRWIKEGVRPEEILILMRNDFRKVISSPLIEALRVRNLPITEQLESTPLDTEAGRNLLAWFRLYGDLNDSLAWRTLLQLNANGIGKKTIQAMNKAAADGNRTFASVLLEIKDKPNLIKQGSKVAAVASDVIGQLAVIRKDNPSTINLVQTLVKNLVLDESLRNQIQEYLYQIIQPLGEDVSIASVVHAINTSLTLGEQELSSDSISIMTMHKAKGLSAGNVIIMGAEDQFIPGRSEGDREGDERRLLYVSMTRARNRLCITYCRSRTGVQVYTGREGGEPRRRITRFLEHAPYQVVSH